MRVVQRGIPNGWNACLGSCASISMAEIGVSLTYLYVFRIPHFPNTSDYAAVIVKCATKLITAMPLR